MSPARRVKRATETTIAPITTQYEERAKVVAAEVEESAGTLLVLAGTAISRLYFLMNLRTTGWTTGGRVEGGWW